MLNAELGKTDAGGADHVVLSALSAIPGLQEVPPAVDPAATAPRAVARSWHFRLFDLVMVAMAMPIALPGILILALVVKLNDPRAPVIFRQTRYGQDGRAFRLLKIRTMVPGAEALKAKVIDLSPDKGAGFKIADDPRVTRPGRWIRKLYLDELPQLFNVLKGGMALVGPRANSYAPDTYEPWQRRRLEVKPGLTGSWQVMLDKPQDFAERCRIDIDYIQNKTLAGDVLILFKTVIVCFLRQNGC